MLCLFRWYDEFNFVRCLSLLTIVSQRRHIASMTENNEVVDIIHTAAASNLDPFQHSECDNYGSVSV